MSFDRARLGEWRSLPFFDAPLQDIAQKLAQDTREILPPRHQVFAALERCQPDATRVVILGQDPYPTPGHAHGLAFSAEAHTRPLPKSLANIFREIHDDMGAAPATADLTFWADQGVLLLNSVLTTPAGVARGHRGLGWEALIDAVLARLDDRPRAFLLWGKDAQASAEALTHPDHLILRAPHPSPLSAYRGFFGARPFSTVNSWLKTRGNPTINWTTAP
ncbi:MAG: uracil-DNA glycosylase [Pseudomonadota bacterium]